MIRGFGPSPSPLSSEMASFRFEDPPLLDANSSAMDPAGWPKKSRLRARALGVQWRRCSRANVEKCLGRIALGSVSLGVSQGIAAESGRVSLTD